MVFGLVLFLMSFSVFADTYPVIILYTVGNSHGSSAALACSTEVNRIGKYGGGLYQCGYTDNMCIYWNEPANVGRCDYTKSGVGVSHSSTCPGGGSISGANCINAPACVAPQVRSTVTGLCADQNCDKPICTSDQNPFSNNCKYADNAGLKIDCTDGSTVNVPQTCPPNKWDYLFSPRQGESATCSDGSTIGYGSNCLDRFVQRNILESQNPGVAAGAIFLGGVIGGGARPVLTLVGTTMKMVFPIGVKTANQELAVTTGRTVVEARTASQAIANYIKANPTSAYTTSLKTAIANGAAGNTITVDPNTGEVLSVCSTAAWSANELAKAALAAAAAGTATLPMPDIEPFVDLGNNPWVEPAVKALEDDFRRVMAEPSASPVNIPAAADPLPSPSPSPWSPSPTPIIDVGPDSPPVYLLPPLATPLPPPTAPINPTDPIIMPTPPTLQPDTWKYFDFLPTSNPFSISPSLPALPETICAYEIHQVVHVPFMGAHNFDIAPCVPLQPLRTVLAWFFSVFTIYTCIFIIFRSNW